MMKKFLSIMKEEYKSYLKDKGVMLITIIAVIAYSLFYAVPYCAETIKDAPVGVVNLDQSGFSKTFIKNIDATDAIKVEEAFSSIEETKKSFYKGDIRAFIIIPPDFEKDILKGKQTNVAFYGDTAYLIIYKSIFSTLLQACVDIGADIEVKKMMKAGISKKQAQVMKSPFQFVQIPVFNQAGGYMSYVYPVILILILHQTLVVGLGLRQGTRNERKKKYVKEEKDLPLAILARTTAYLPKYFLYATVIFLIYPAVFVYPIYYNIFPLMCLYVLMFYSAGFFAQTISYWFRIREASVLIMIPSSLIFIFIPGLIWPREAIPDVINLFSFFIPATCGIDGIIKLNQNGATVNDIAYDYLWLAFLCIFYFITATYLTKKSDRSFDE